jgi:hypothetical protein
MATPRKLYRFYSPVASRLLLDKKLWFSSIKDFNDIFEMRPRFDGAMPGYIREAQARVFALRPKIIPDFETFVEKVTLSEAEIEIKCEEYADHSQEAVGRDFGVLCLCAELGSPAVWGHYTRSNTGFAIEFDGEHAVFSGENCYQMTYEPERPQFDPDPENLLKMTRNKCPDWSYESEYRVILPRELLRWEKRNPGDAKEMGFLPLPTDAVQAVYFGCKADSKTLAALTEGMKSLPHVKAYRMKTHPTEYKLIPVSYA